MRTRRKISTLAGGVGAHQLDRRRPHATSGPRSVFTSTGKKQSTAAIAIFDVGLERVEPGVVIGANAMIGTAFAAIAIRHAARRRAAASARATSATRIAERRADDEAAERLLEREPARRAERRAVVPERRWRSSVGCGSRNCWMSKHARSRPPRREHGDEDDDRGSQSTRAAPDALRSAPRGLGCDRDRLRAHCRLRVGRSLAAVRAASRTSVTSSKKRGSSRVSPCAAAAGRSATMPAIRPGPRATSRRRASRGTPPRRSSA